MANHFSGVGLMDLGTLDALKKFSAVKTTQPTAPLPEKNTALSAKEASKEVVEKDNPKEKNILNAIH